MCPSYRNFLRYPQKKTHRDISVGKTLGCALSQPRLGPSAGPKLLGSAGPAGPIDGSEGPKLGPAGSAGAAGPAGPQGPLGGPDGPLDGPDGPRTR